jgi:hypothetical protein
MPDAKLDDMKDGFSYGPCETNREADDSKPRLQREYTL